MSCISLLAKLPASRLDQEASQVPTGVSVRGPVKPVPVRLLPVLCLVPP